MSTAPRQVRGLTSRSNGSKVYPVTGPLSDPDIPLLHEDDGFDDMGDTSTHTRSNDIIFYGLQYHLPGQGSFAVYSNLNLYYSATDRTAYVSPDIMVVPPPAVNVDLRSYRIGEAGPAPIHVVEVLSERTFQQQDLSDKPLIYSRMKVPEYVLIDVTGQYLSVRLLLKQLQPNGAWLDLRDGGITSRLGFRVIIDEDGQVRMMHTATGKRYARPQEAQTALDDAEARLQSLQAELAKCKRRRKKKD